MYHISLFFDEKTTAHMRRFIEKVAEATGNDYMLEAQVPPHITLCALEFEDEEALKERLEHTFAMGPSQSGTLQWVSVGVFFPGVIFLQPVLNTYLQGLSEQVYACVQDLSKELQGTEQTRGGLKIKACYKPFSWIPHSTVAKKLTPEQLQAAFEVLQKDFAVFEGRAVRIGLAKMNPHREIASWNI